MPGGALSLDLLTTQTIITTGILPLQGKLPMVELGIEPGTSWLVVRSSDHQTTRLVAVYMMQVFTSGRVLIEFDLLNVSA